MDRSTLQLTIGILLGIFLLVLVILTVVYVRRRLAEKRETAMRDPDIFQDETLRDGHTVYAITITLITSTNASKILS